MKRFQIQTRSGQLTWLQLLSLAISGLFFVIGSTVPAFVMLLLATLFGVAAMIRRYREAQHSNPELFRKRRRR